MNSALCRHKNNNHLLHSCAAHAPFTTIILAYPVVCRTTTCVCVFVGQILMAQQPGSKNL